MAEHDHAEKAEQHGGQQTLVLSAADEGFDNRVQRSFAGTIDANTFGFDMLNLDAAGDPVGSHWHTYDLSEIQRGAPTDLTVRIPADQAIEGLGVVAPSLGLSEGDDAFLEELRGLPAE